VNYTCQLLKVFRLVNLAVRGACIFDAVNKRCIKKSRPGNVFQGSRFVKRERDGKLKLTQGSDCNEIRIFLSVGFYALVQFKLRVLLPETYVGGRKKISNKSCIQNQMPLITLVHSVSHFLCCYYGYYYYY
jgi:hypothetical protein